MDQQFLTLVYTSVKDIEVGLEEVQCLDSLSAGERQFEGEGRL